jgi:hypothetical protein
MAATASAGTGLSASQGADGIAGFTGSPARLRRITPQAGRALEILGHAIDYLIDENVHEAGARAVPIGQMEAVQLLMKLNRQVYLECPEVPTMSERCRSLLGLRAA